MFKWFIESIILKSSILKICENKCLVIRTLGIFFLVLFLATAGWTGECKDDQVWSPVSVQCLVLIMIHPHHSSAISSSVATKIWR